MNPEGRSRQGAFRLRHPKTFRVPPWWVGQVGNALEAWLGCRVGRGLESQGACLGSPHH